MEITPEKIKQALLSIVANILANSYARENISLGIERPGETVSVKQYEEVFQLPPVNWQRCLAGSVINDDGTISTDASVDQYRFEFYADKIHEVFRSAPTVKKLLDAGEPLAFKPALNQYFTDLYPLFKEICETEVVCDFFDLLVPEEDKKSVSVRYENWQNFVCAIKIKHLRQGGCIDRYIKDFGTFPHYLKRLVKIQKGRFLLANSDTDSLDYKLALFSVMTFLNREHGRLLELKMKRWEELHKNRKKKSANATALTDFPFNVKI